MSYLNFETGSWREEKSYKKFYESFFVFSVDDKELFGYFTLALKPLAVRGKMVSNTTKRKLLRISELDENSDTYNMSAYLIAQLGKNYTDGANTRIAGKELVELAWTGIAFKAALMQQERNLLNVELSVNGDTEVAGGLLFSVYTRINR